MNEHWERVTSLFGAARVLDPETRTSFLDVACRGDDELRAELETMLAADTQDDGFLDDPPWVTLAEPPETTLTNGQVLKNRYRVDKEIASGGQALVYEAHDLLLTRSVVIKVMRAEGRRNRWLKERFEHEMRALARIDHSGVVGIVDVGDLDDGSPYLVIQHIPGVTLREALAHGPMPPARVAEIVRQIGSALHAAHVAGIAHRDLKPENVMLQRQGDAETVKLIDFGIAKVEKAGLEPNTTTVMVAGTVRYMAPEQFEGRNSVASDIYAVALVVCEMLTGYPDIRALPKSLRRQVRVMLQSALAFRAEDRPSDVQAWSRQLAETLGSGRMRTARAVGLIVLALILVGGAAASERWRFGNWGEPVRIIEKVGAFDPLTEGFETHNDISGTVTENPTRTAYDGWSASTKRQGYYFHTFTAAQKRRAFERGWKLTVIMRGEEGNTTVGADFSAPGPRFDINLVQDGDHEVVRLLTQIIPNFRGLELQQSPPHAYHQYELVYDPVLKNADLLIDGQLRLRGYRGFSQYLEDRGLTFGAALYKSDRGSGSFKSVRFEISP